jgi:glycosyltransferase involved in cell wall biosynthesis
LIYLGRLDKVKNLEYLLSELSHNVKIPYTLTMAGEGESAYVNTLKQMATPTTEIHWRGQVEGEEKFKLLAQADILVLPSHTENFGNVVIEALSQGTPVLLSDNVGAKDYVMANEVGWVVKTTPGNWAEVINTIWNNKAARVALRQKAKTCIKRDFNQNIQVEAYLSMYRDNMMNTHALKKHAEN